MDFDLHHNKRPLFNGTDTLKKPLQLYSQSEAPDGFKMAAGTRVPCDGQINCISKQYRKKEMPQALDVLALGREILSRDLSPGTR